MIKITKKEIRRRIRQQVAVDKERELRRFETEQHADLPPRYAVQILIESCIYSNINESRARLFKAEEVLLNMIKKLEEYDENGKKLK